MPHLVLLRSNADILIQVCKAAWAHDRIMTCWSNAGVDTNVLIINVVCECLLSEGTWKMDGWMDRWMEGSMRTVRMCGLSLSWYHSMPSGNKWKTWLVYRKLLFCFNFPLISTGEMCFCVYFSLFQWNPCQGFSKWSSVLNSGEVVKGFRLWSHICCLCWLPIKSHSSCIFSSASLSTTQTSQINEMLKFLHLYEPSFSSILCWEKSYNIVICTKSFLSLIQICGVVCFASSFQPAAFPKQVAVPHPLMPAVHFWNKYTLPLVAKTIWP